MGELTCERRLVVRSGAEAIQLRWIEPGGHSPRPMKLARATHPLLIAALLAMPAGVNGQVVSDFPVCTNYRERYQGGGFDNDGNYVPGFVMTERFNIDCGTATNGAGSYRRYQGNPLNPSCNPTRTILAGTLGAGIGAAIKRSARRYTVPIGAALFGLATSC